MPHSTFTRTALLLAFPALLTAACATTEGDGVESDSTVDDGTGGDGATTMRAGTGGSLSVTPVDPEGIICDSRTGDQDGDGYSVEDGDCNDCDVNANPGALDVSGNKVDEDCNGLPDDNLHLDCDTDLVFNSNEPSDAAKALGLCKDSDPKARSWGLISATYTLADGTLDDTGPFHAGHGLLENFGTSLEPREGSRLLALSTGRARDKDDSGYLSPAGQQHLSTVTAPSGFPVQSTTCGPTDIDTHATDSVVLEVKLKAPTNAKSLSFDFNFHTFEFPDYICSEFNDNFIVLMDPPPESAKLGNVSFDTDGNPVNVNAGFLSVCTPQMAGGKDFACDLGATELDGTGFEDHAATGWLTTTVPITPGQEFTLKFMIWDTGWREDLMSGDYFLDSTVLLDNLTFSAEPATAAYTTPVTK